MPELGLDQLAARLRVADVVDVRPLSGGASGLTYSGVMGGRAVVVKVAPPGVAPILNRDVLRQAQMIRALGPTPVPVPEVLWEEAGAPPDVPPLFVMSSMEGTSVEPLFDLQSENVELAVMVQRQYNAARTLAALHRVGPGSLRLGDVPVTGFVDEIDRWCRTLETVDQALVVGWEEIGDALRASAPTPLAPAVVHGDFRLGNLLAVGARITAIVDWEIWSVSDPRVDVGWFLLNGDPNTYRRQTRYAGSMPTTADLAAAYADSFGAPLAEIEWFEALAAFKSVATWSLIVKHNRRRSSPDAGIETMVSVLPRLLLRAQAGAVR
jgi:aminoglycoside phosphotransferase (APT) family kinase protein